MNPDELRGYPKKVAVDGADIRLRAMRVGDRDAVMTFAQALPAHDLLFLRRDITRPDIVEDWVRNVERGRVVTVLAEDERGLQGYATVDRGDLTWSPHVAEIRVLVAPAHRGKALGRRLTEEAFTIALALGIEKVVAQMTTDQKAAIAVFEGMGFRAEALLRDHVKDREGRTHDLVILSHEVSKFRAQLDAYGVSDALER
jgi:L-amino acid N-acyltransferase YncA